jgi:protein required for attachment to host cells
MQLPHDAFILVADGRKMLFFRNEGDDEYPHLVVEHAEARPNPSDAEQKTDTAGRASSAWGGGSQSSPGSQNPGGGGADISRGQGGGFAPARSSMQEADYHQMEEDRFAADTAELLKKRALAREFESLVIVAPPKTLGELRKHYHKEVADRLIGEIDKDLTGHPVDQIEKALAGL